MLPIPYQDPIDQGPLIQEPAGFRNPRTGTVYPDRNGIPVFLPPGVVEGPNALYQKMYDRFAPFYGVLTRLYAWWKSGADANRRKAYLDLLEVHGGASFLEVSVGTGANWQYLKPDMDFYGLDLTAGMLDRCYRQARRLKLRFELCQGLAEHLPFPSAAFDCVFHMGGINFFSDPRAALAEMVRVAKPDGRLVIVDPLAPESDAKYEIYNRLERLRDPSHTLTLRLTEFLRLFDEAGLEILRQSLRRRQRSFNNWMLRGGHAPGTKRYLETRKLMEDSMDGDRGGFSAQSLGEDLHFVHNEGMFLLARKSCA